MANLKITEELKDYVLRRGEYKDQALHVDYNVRLCSQKGFEKFNRLLSKVEKSYSTEEWDEETDKMMICFLNSTFWYYDVYYDEKTGRINEKILEDMCVTTYVMDELGYNLQCMADCYRGRKDKFSRERVILQQQLRPMVKYITRNIEDYGWKILPLLIIKECETQGKEILLFETDDSRATKEKSTREIKLISDEEYEQLRQEDIADQELGYLDKDYVNGRIVSREEYIDIIREVKTILRTGAKPVNIKRLMLSARGTLQSGDSYKFVTFGICQLFWRLGFRSKVQRTVWLEYLIEKTGKTKELIEKKFSERPSKWEEKLKSEEKK